MKTKLCFLFLLLSFAWTMSVVMAKEVVAVEKISDMKEKVLKDDFGVTRAFLSFPLAKTETSYHDTKISWNNGVRTEENLPIRIEKGSNTVQITVWGIIFPVLLILIVSIMSRYEKVWKLFLFFALVLASVLVLPILLMNGAHGEVMLIFALPVLAVTSLSSYWASNEKYQSWIFGLFVSLAVMLSSGCFVIREGGISLDYPIFLFLTEMVCFAIACFVKFLKRHAPDW